MVFGGAPAFNNQEKQHQTLFTNHTQHDHVNYYSPAECLELLHLRRKVLHTLNKQLSPGGSAPTNSGAVHLRAGSLSSSYSRRANLITAATAVITAAGTTAVRVVVSSDLNAWFFLAAVVVMGGGGEGDAAGSRLVLFTATVSSSKSATAEWSSAAVQGSQTLPDRVLRRARRTLARAWH